jgi:hypothetical protein
VGFAKNQMMEQEERGYGSIDKLACHNCVGNEALKAFIIETGSEDECDYCGCSDTCVCVEDLLKKIVDGIYFEYARAVDELGWVDGSYVGSTWDKYDLLHDELFDEMNFKDELFEDICDTINDETWCERDPYGLRESQGRIFMWNEFCRMVKTKMRYVFFRMPEKDRHQEIRRRQPGSGSE